MKGCRPVTDCEANAILAALPSARDRALFVLGCRTGFRISELLSLRVRNVWANGRVNERVSVERRYMKKKQEGRTVILHSQAKEAITAWVKEIGEVPPDTMLFKSREGENKAINRRTAWGILEKAFAAAGMTGKLGTHSMRKTFAKRVHEKVGKDLIKTQKALGHKNINSTVSYLSFAEEEIDEAILGS
jgi:site-specific recombinase XerD